VPSKKPAMVPAAALMPATMAASTPSSGAGGEPLVNTGAVLENPVSGQRLIFRKTAQDTGGELLEVEAVYAKPTPSRPPVHHHPRQEERFEVLSGRLNVLVGGQDRTLGEGEVLIVASSVPHQMWAAEAGARQLADAPCAQDGGVLRDRLGTGEGQQGKRQGRTQPATGGADRSGVRG
jgi:quercetin dioxygenase-like cupin family protein